MNDEDILIIGGIAVLAIIGIVYGLASSLENLLVSLGLSPGIAGQFGAFLFFLILALLVVFVIRQI